MTGRGRTVQRVANAAPLPLPLKKRGPALFNQQCWLWGCDIRREAGNLLLEYGFARTRPPEGVKGSNCYHLALDRERHVVLWAFGSWYGDAARGGLLLNRYSCMPCLGSNGVPPLDAWQPEQVRDVEVPQTPEQWRRSFGLLADLLDWIATYEQWVIASAGLDYREACVAAWERGSCRISPQTALREWQALATTCRGAKPTLRAAEEQGCCPG